MITNLTNLPANFQPNYMLTISWVDGNNNMFRYAMWKGVGEVVFENIPLYSGQKIAKNFRFEVWSTDLVTVGQLTPLQFTTSVLQAIDYRYGVDNTLVNSDPIVTSFKDAALSGSIIVSGAGTPSINGTYTLNGQFNGKNLYQSGINTINWTGGFGSWIIGTALSYYTSSSNVATPDLATGWAVGMGATNPPPTVTTVSSVFLLPLTWPVPSQPILNP